MITEALNVPEWHEYKIIPLILTFKDKHVIESFKKALPKIASTPGVTEFEILKDEDGHDVITDNNTYAIFVYKITSKFLDKKIIITILLNQTNTGNEEYYIQRAKEYSIEIPSLAPNALKLRQGWKLLFGGEVRNSFDKIEQSYFKKLKAKKSEKIVHNRLEALMIHYKAKGVNKKLINTLKEKFKGLQAGIAGLDHYEYFMPKNLPVSVLYLHYKEKNTRQVSIIFETDQVKEGELLTSKNERVSILLKEIPSTIELQWINPEDIVNYLKQANEILYERPYQKIQELEDKIKKARNNHEKEKLAGELEGIKKKAIKEGILPKQYI